MVVMRGSLSLTRRRSHTFDFGIILDMFLGNATLVSDIVF